MKTTEFQYMYMHTLITKIIFLMRLIGSMEKPVILHSSSNKLKFVVFVASLLAGEKLYIVHDKSAIVKLAMSEKIGLVLSDSILNDPLQMEGLKMELYCDVHKKLLFNSRNKTFQFLIPTTGTKHAYEIVKELRHSAFKNETSVLCKKAADLKRRPVSKVIIITGTTILEYTSKNIMHMVRAIGDTFGSVKEPVFVNFSKTNFEENFAYMLYFFLRGDLLALDFKALIYGIKLKFGRKLKELIFINSKNFEKLYHERYKHVIYSKGVALLHKYKCTRWIINHVYALTIRPFSKRNNEYIFINPRNSLSRRKFLKFNNAKVSIIFGTPADGYTLAINRYNEKDTCAVKNSYRIMDGLENSIKIDQDIHNKLYIGGERVSDDMRNKVAIHSRSKTDLFHQTNKFCTLEGEILTIDAEEEDIYYNTEGTSVIDIGTKQKALLDLPYVKDAEVFKFKGEFIAVIDIDIEFIQENFQVPILGHVISKTNEVINIINNQFSDSEKISRLIVSGRFFTNMERILHFTSKKNFIRILNQQPFNYFDS